MLNYKSVEIQVLTTSNIKITALWDVAPCSFVEVDDVLEARTVSIIRAIALKRRYTSRLYGAISQKAVIVHTNVIITTYICL
jgi:hypothetical protein